MQTFCIKVSILYHKNVHNFRFFNFEISRNEKSVRVVTYSISVRTSDDLGAIRL